MPRGKKAASAARSANSGSGRKKVASGAAQTRSVAASRSGAELDFEEKLWKAADNQRNNVDAAEYKHVVLGLIFLKYISDAFEYQRTQLQADPEADPEDRLEYKAANVFWVPKEARWSAIAAKAKSPKIGSLINDAMSAIEKDNPSLKTVLPKEFTKPNLDPTRLGALVDLVSGIGLGDAESRKKDILGRVYEYFLGKFASAEGQKSGQFYTPRSVVRLLVEMIEPYKGRVFDPCCGSGGMFVQSEEFVLAHHGRRQDLSIFGQESNYTTWRLAKMNMAIRGIEADIAWNTPGSFLQDAFPDLKADFVLANPPFNDSEWGAARLKDDKRWKFGLPPESSANFAWIQHFIQHLAPTGVAAFVMANGAMSSNQNGEGGIRTALIEAKGGGVVDCVIALPAQLFFSTQIAVSVWILARDRHNHKFRDRRQDILFVDGRKLGEMTDRTHKTLRDGDIARIAGVYHAWRTKGNDYNDVAGFCKSATLDEVRKHRHVLTPARYVGTEDLEDDAEPFAEKMARLSSLLREQQLESVRLDGVVAVALERAGYGG